MILSPEAVGLVSLVVMFALIVLRVPVAMAMGLMGVAGYAILDGIGPALNRLGNTPFDLAEGYSLSVVPLFLLMGAVASRSGLSRELFDAASALFAGRRGTAAMASVVACAGFSAIAGSSLATAATMSRVSIPEMRRLGYDERLAAGAVAAGGTLGILIPPSVVLIVYAVIAQASVARLFAAGLVPGVLLTVLQVGVVWLIVRARPGLAPAPDAPRPWPARLGALAGTWQVVALFGVSVGGIYAGLFSPTEGAAVGALLAILFGLGAGRIRLFDVAAAMGETVRTTAVLFLIVIMAFAYAYFLILTQLPQGLVGFVQDLGLPPLAVILLLVVFYVVLGCFLDSLGMVLMTVPVFLPLVLSQGYDPIWFGVMVVVVVEIGLITPPVGMNLFVIRAQQPDIAIETLYRGVTPFLAANAALLVLLLAFPGLATWLPRLLYG